MPLGRPWQALRSGRRGGNFPAGFVRFHPRRPGLPSSTEEPQIAHVLPQDHSLDAFPAGARPHARPDAHPTALRAREVPLRANHSGHFGTVWNGVFGVMCITAAARRLPRVKPFVHYHSWRFSFRGELPVLRSRARGIRGENATSPASLRSPRRPLWRSGPLLPRPSSGRQEDAERTKRGETNETK